MLKLFTLSLYTIWSVDGATLGLRDHNTRILGGQLAGENEFPYQVSLRRTTSREFHYCGGSIINTKWILTAAHCVIGRTANELTAVVGSNSLTNGGDRHQVEQIIQHEDYNDTSLANDVALLLVETEFEFNTRVGPISLPDAETPAGTSCVVSGWGYIDTEQTTTDSLQSLVMPTITLDQCQEDLKEFRDENPITEKQVCTAPIQNTGACNGDSGGPLANNGVIVGIVSFGASPCGSGYPDVYANVFAYRDWIEDKISN